ncbi:MAG: carboxypeptidase regulatory-like domain-containing protein, partial [Vicinamibacterales bacterium]
MSQTECSPLDLSGLMVRVLRALLVLALAPVAPSLAQMLEATLRGTVTDETGSGLPGVTIATRQVDTGVVRLTVTSSSGTYLLAALPTGQYRVTLQLAGFKTIVHEDLELSAGRSALVNFTMALAAREETVTVRGDAPLVDSADSSLSGRIEPEQIENLPLNGRDWLDLVALVPGARGNPGTVRAGAAGADTAKYQVDGLDVSNQASGGSNQRYGLESLAEFQVLTNRFDAEYGRVGGIVINAVTKSGTNQWRGTGFGFLRDDRFDAKNFFTNRVSPFHEKQIGMTSGGPIVRDRAHWFASYEHQIRDITARPNTGIAQFDVDASQDIARHLSSLRVDTQLTR